MNHKHSQAIYWLASNTFLQALERDYILGLDWEADGSLFKAPFFSFLVTITTASSRRRWEWIRSEPRVIGGRQLDWAWFHGGERSSINSSSLITPFLFESCLVVVFIVACVPKGAVDNDATSLTTMAIMKLLMVLGNRLILPLMGRFSSFLAMEIRSKGVSFLLLSPLSSFISFVAPQTTASSTTISCSCASTSWEYWWWSRSRFT